MPEVKFQNISEGNEANAIIKYDKGFYIQSITQGQIQQAGSVDVTACHGIKIISHSCSGPMFPNTHAREQEEEMDYTKCFSSNQFAQNTAKDVETGDGEQTRIFSENVAGIELDETCSRREIFNSHRCLPSSSQTSLEEKEQKIDATPFLASLKSGSSRSYEKSGDDFKIDSTSFPTSLQPRLSGVQMSEGHSSYDGNISLKRQPFVELTHQNMNGNRTLQQEKLSDDLELTTCHSSGEINDDHIIRKRDRRNVYEAADVDVTVCVGSGLSYQKDYPPQELQVAGETQIFVDDGEVELNVTACHGGIIDGNYLQMFGMESRKQEEDMEHTKCFSTSQFMQTMATSVDLGSHEQTKIFSEDAGVDLDVTCSPRDIFFQNYSNEEKQDATAFLASLKSSSLKSPEKDIFPKGGKISHSFLEQKSACVQKSESGLVASGNISIEQRPFVEITCNTTLQKYGTQQESTNENIELTACYNYEVQTKTEKSKRRSIYEPADVDVTTCFGSGLINSPDSIALGGRIHETSNHGSNNCTGLNSIEHLGDQNDATILRCHALETRSNNAIDYRSVVTHETQEAHEQAGQLDLTKCYGGVILHNKQGTDHASFPSRSTDALDFTICHGQDSLFTTPSSSQTHQNNNTDSCKIDTSAFLASLNKSNEAAVLDCNDDMDLTATFTAGSAASSSEKFKSGLHDQTAVDKVSGCTASVDSKHHIIEDDNLEFTACHSHKGIENNMENSKRKSIYEPADLDITSCYGSGLRRSSTTQALNDSMNSTLDVAPTNQEAAIDLPHDGSVFNKTQDFPVTRQHKPGEFETDLSKCRTRVHNMKIKNYFRSSEVGLMASFCSQPVSSSDQQVTSKSPYKILNMPSRKGSAADEQNNATTLDTMQGHKVVEALDESRLKLTTCHNYKVCEKNAEFYSQKMESQMEESRLELTTCHKYEVFHNDEDLQSQKIAQQLEEPRQEVGTCQRYVNTPDDSQNLQNQTIPQYLEVSKSGLQFFGNSELQSNDEEVQGMPEQLDIGGKEDLQNLPQYFEESQFSLTHYSNNKVQSNDEELQGERWSEQLDVSNHQDLQSQTMPQILNESTEGITPNCDSEILDGTKDLPRQMTTHQLAESGLQLNTTCPDQEDIDDEQMTSKYNNRKLSIIQETDSELTNNQEQNITQ